MSEFSTNQTQSRSGLVVLVGAGPGDPGLITLRGVETLGPGGCCGLRQAGKP